MGIPLLNVHFPENIVLSIENEKHVFRSCVQDSPRIWLQELRLMLPDSITQLAQCRAAKLVPNICP